MQKIEIVTKEFEAKTFRGGVVLAIELDDLRFIVNQYRYELADEIKEAYEEIYRKEIKDESN